MYLPNSPFYRPNLQSSYIEMLDLVFIIPSTILYSIFIDLDVIVHLPVAMLF